MDFLCPPMALALPDRPPGISARPVGSSVITVASRIRCWKAPSQGAPIRTGFSFEIGRRMGRGAAACHRTETACHLRRRLQGDWARALPTIAALHESGFGPTATWQPPAKWSVHRAKADGRQPWPRHATDFSLNKIQQLACVAMSKGRTPCAGKGRGRRANVVTAPPCSGPYSDDPNARSRPAGVINTRTSSIDFPSACKVSVFAAARPCRTRSANNSGASPCAIIIDVEHAPGDRARSRSARRQFPCSRTHACAL
jgi:hypothetical protein